MKYGDKDGKDRKGDLNDFHKDQASIMIELALDEMTTEHTRIAIFTKLLESKKDKTFFASMYDDKLSYGACPHCEHENHWLVPEVDLNQMGWITSEQDTRVKNHTTEEDCPDYQEACVVKKVTT